MRIRWLVLVYLFGGICWNVTAQQRGGDLEIKTASGEVVGTFAEAHALIIGESGYTNGWRRLPGVKEDVVAVKKLFEEQGFKVVTIEDANSRNLKRGITDFLDKYAYNQNARIVVYFAGHGATVDLSGRRRMGYIVPVDAPPASNNRNFLQAAIPMAQFETWAKQYDSRHILFIFDSCFAGTVFRSQGSAPPAINRLINQPVRQFITSGDADEEVPDESIFRKELENALRNAAADSNGDGYVSGKELGNYLYDRVSNYMNGRQNPREGKLNDTNLDKGDFIFAVSSGGSSGDVTPYNFVRINGGTFTMGSLTNETGRNDDEEPQHQVTIKSFYIGKYEVTQKEFREVMGTNPSNFKGDNLPVENVSWYDAIEYCNRRSELERLTPVYMIDKTRSDPNNKHSYDNVRWMVTWNRNANGYRLPTEAEWEYACRAGTTTAYNIGNSLSTNLANYNNTLNKTTNVGSYVPNPWGLHDIHGNVWEWCWDWFGNYSGRALIDPMGVSSGYSRVMRGGSWFNTAHNARSAMRGEELPYNRRTDLGFRVVRAAQ